MVVQNNINILNLQICSQHESVLMSHLDMLSSAKELARSDDDLLRAVSSMFERTNKLMSQFRVVKKQMVCCCLAFFLALLYFATSCPMS